MTNETFSELVRKYRRGTHVRVTNANIESDGVGPAAKTSGAHLRKHGHAGKTGFVLELVGVYVRARDGKLRAHIRIDEGFDDAGGVMIVLVDHLELVPDA